MKLPVKLPVVFLLPTALALLGAAAYGAFFLYEVMESSVGAGGGKYAVKLPAVKPFNTKEAPQCAQKTAKWLGCF
jgi:hypothetical protein